jgi:hypothetical protein
MNRNELQEALCREHIKSTYYSLEAENFDPNEALCLRQEGNEWLVYYSERGLQTGKRSFQSESEACTYMLEQLQADPTAKVGWSSGFRVPSGA